MSAQQEQNNGNPTPNSAANPVETDAGANVSSIPTPLPRQRPRKNKWLQSQGPLSQNHPFHQPKGSKTSLKFCANLI